MLRTTLWVCRASGHPLDGWPSVDGIAIHAMPDWERQTLPYPHLHVAVTNHRPPGELEISLALANRIAVRHFNGLRSEINPLRFRAQIERAPSSYGEHMQNINAETRNMLSGIKQTALPDEGFMRIDSILAIFPISRSAWWAGVKAGIYPRGMKLSPRCTAWNVKDIRDLLARVGGEGGAK